MPGPPEPLPWDRKDLAFKDRKHERGAGCDAVGGGGGSASAPRWKDPLSAPRELPRASPCRPPSGHYRQGGGYCQVYPEESCGTPSRPSDRSWLEDDSLRASSARFASGRSSSNSSRESRGSLGRSPYSDSGDFSRHHHELPVTAQRSVAVTVSQSSSPLLLKDQHDKSGGGVDDGPSAGHRYDRDHSLGSIGWKPRKWTHPCSLSSSKNVRSESDEAGLQVSVPAGKETPILSPVMSPLPSDEGAPKKKQRLGWGQGLAKFEKQKIDGSADVSVQNGSVQGANSAKGFSNKTSPKLTGVAGCSSPATLSSAISSSSPGLLDMARIKEANNDTSQHGDSSGLGFQNCSNELSVKLDSLEISSSSTLTSLLANLFQPEDACSGDSSFSRQAAMNKLLVLKGDVSKELEKTECEIDLFENELKTLNGDGKNDSCQSSFTLKAHSVSDPCVEPPDVSSQVLLDSTPSKDCVLPSSVTLAGKSLVHTDFVDEHDALVKDVNDDSLETHSSKCGKSASPTIGISDYEAPKLTRCSFDGGDTPGNVCAHGDGNCIDADSIGVFSDFHKSLNVKVDNLIATIVASNRYAAKEASQVFAKALVTDPPQFDIWGSDNILSCRRNDVYVKEKLAVRKHLLKFKERVLTLKFRAFHHLWKEDLRLLSMRKHRPKSQKRFELSSRASQSGPQRHRSSIRSRFTLPAGNLTLVPTTEIVDFTTKLLSDSQTKLYRNYLKVPALILDEKEKRYSRFITYNRLIEDPLAFEEETALINPWTQQEKDTFMEMLATLGKDFTKISSFIKSKTTADCIEFYYKNHKSESFGVVRSRLYLRKQFQPSGPTNSYLVTSGKKWNREVNAASLDMLGEASVVASHSNVNKRHQQKYARKTVFGSYHDLNVSRGSYASLERANTAEISRYERETAVAGTCGASEAMSSCVTSSIDPAEKMNYMALGRPFTPEVTRNIDEEDTCSDEGCGELESVDWIDEEKSAFIRALSMYGKDFARISSLVGTRSREQCKIFFSKARKSLGLDLIHQGPYNGGTPITDMNGGGSDTDDACAPEMDSAICSTQSCSKLDTDFTQSVANTSSEGFVPTDTPMHSETDRSSGQYELGGPNQEEVEAKIDRHTSVLNEDKPVKDGDISLPDNFPKELGDAVLRCNEPIHFHEVTEDFVDRKTEEGGNDHASTPVKAVANAYMDDEQLKSHSVADVQLDDSIGCNPDDGLKSEVDSRRFLVPGSGFVNLPRTKVDNDAVKSVPDDNTNGNVASMGTMVNVSHSPTLVHNYQHQMPLERLPCLQEKPQAILSKQENFVSLPLGKVLPDPSSICFKGLQHITFQSSLNIEVQGNKRPTRDFYQECLMGNLSMNQVNQPLHILRGYPLQGLNPKETKRDADPINEKPVPLESISNGNASPRLNQFFIPDTQNGKCNGSVLSYSRSGRSEKAEVRLQPCSQTSCVTEEEQAHRTGDVKLFGQILTNPSSSQKSNSSAQESDSRPLSPKQRSSTMKPMNGHKIDHLRLEGPPLSSYGFWDGNRIQTGYSALPESAIMLAKCQGSQPGAYLGPTEYQQAYKKTLAAEEKRNGFETVSGLQQQGIEFRYYNGGRDRDPGGSGGGPDPVAALKMQYAGRAKICKSEVETWKRGEM